MSSTLDPARRAVLMGAKLAAVVRDHGAEPVGDPAGLGDGVATLTADASAWALLNDGTGRGLGGALAWSVRRDATALHVVGEAGTGVLARRAAGFTLPVHVWHLEGRVLLPAVAEPLAEPSPVSPAHRALAELIVAGGAEPVEEHGVLSGEVRGLEVCRVVDDPISGATRLEVGVGAHDRETFQMLHGDRPTVEALADVVRAVDGHRSADTVHHPLTQLAASRLLRWRLVQHPALVGARELRPAEPPVARTNVKDHVPCVAVEVGADAADRHVVVCTTGVDLEVVPYAVDAIAALAGTRCTVAAPARDVIDIQQRLAELVRVPTAFVAVPPS
jgi:hypothetical protein